MDPAKNSKIINIGNPDSFYGENDEEGVKLSKRFIADINYLKEYAIKRGDIKQGYESDINAYALVGTRGLSPVLLPKYNTIYIGPKNLAKKFFKKLMENGSLPQNKISGFISEEERPNHIDFCVKKGNDPFFEIVNVVDFTGQVTGISYSSYDLYDAKDKYEELKKLCKTSTKFCEKHLNDISYMQNKKPQDIETLDDEEMDEYE